MALQPSVSFTRIGAGLQTLEVYLDLTCPFSAKMTRSLTANVIPLILPSGSLHSQLSLLIRPYAQPFHLGSVPTLEAILAFGSLHPELFWTYFCTVMDKQEDYYNMLVEGRTGKDTKDRLAVLAGEVLEKAQKDGKGTGTKGPLSKSVGEFRDKLTIKGSPNGGNAVTDDLKYFTKLGRQNSIHVTPSVLFNGLFDSSVSSSWGAEEWTKYLEEGIQGLTIKALKAKQQIVTVSG